MAISLERELEQYPDCPLTNYPVSVDVFDRMSDVNSVLWPLIGQFNDYAAVGNFEACNNLLRNNPELVKCLFNADKYNQLRDAIIAMEKFISNNIEKFINTVAQAAAGINDNPSAEEASLVAYSAEKTNSLLVALKDRVRYILNVTIPKASFVDNVFTYQNSKILAKHEPRVNFAEASILPASKARVIVKAYDGYMTFKVKKLPTEDLTVESIILTKIS